jgi:hypothetical protein
VQVGELPTEDGDRRERVSRELRVGRELRGLRDSVQVRVVRGLAHRDLLQQRLAIDVGALLQAPQPEQRGLVRDPLAIELAPQLAELALPRGERGREIRVPLLRLRDGRLVLAAELRGARLDLLEAPYVDLLEVGDLLGQAAAIVRSSPASRAAASRSACSAAAGSSAPAPAAWQRARRFCSFASSALRLAPSLCASARSAAFSEPSAAASAAVSPRSSAPTFSASAGSSPRPAATIRRSRPLSLAVRLRDLEAASVSPATCRASAAPRGCAAAPRS